MSSEYQAAPRDFSDIVSIIRHQYVNVIEVHIEPNVTTLDPGQTGFVLHPMVLAPSLNRLVGLEPCVMAYGGDGKVHMRFDVSESDFVYIGDQLCDHFKGIVGEDKVFLSPLLTSPDPS